MVKGAVDATEIEGMTVHIGRHLGQLLAEPGIGIDSEVGSCNITDSLRPTAKGLQRVEDSCS